MILSMLLTMVFGFGVLTLATIALLNVAGLRMHDLREEQRSGESSVAYAYTSQGAYDLRSSVGKLPRRLKWGATLAVALVMGLYASVDPAASGDAQEALGGEHLTPVGIITWVSIAAYVVALLWVAASISRRCYVVLQETEHRGPSQTGKKQTGRAST